jgi:hypothetical protein
MIAKRIFYCWFGNGEMSNLNKRCIESWKKYCPDYEIILINELTYDWNSNPYAKTGYEAGNWSAVSNAARLEFLKQYSGFYLDTDVEVVKPFEPLLNDVAFCGLEESLAHLPGTCVMGCEAHCEWVKTMLGAYDNITFVKPDGSYDITTNTRRLGNILCENGFIPSREAQYIAKWGLRIYTHDYFSPITSTRVMRKSKNTYAIHHLESSWSEGYIPGKIKRGTIYNEVINFLVQIKRRLKGIK